MPPPSMLFGISIFSQLVWNFFAYSQVHILFFSSDMLVRD
jgi:hypothetical protein